MSDQTSAVASSASAPIGLSGSLGFRVFGVEGQGEGEGGWGVDLFHWFWWGLEVLGFVGKASLVGEREREREHLVATREPHLI